MGLECEIISVLIVEVGVQVKRWWACRCTFFFFFITPKPRVE